MGQEFTDSLPFQAILSGTFLLSWLLYKLAWTLSSLLITSMYLSAEEQNALAQYAQRGLLGKFIGFLVLLVGTALKLLAAFAQVR